MSQALVAGLLAETFRAIEELEFPCQVDTIPCEGCMAHLRDGGCYFAMLKKSILSLAEKREWPVE